jgi:DNA topoisomerase IB
MHKLIQSVPEVRMARYVEFPLEDGGSIVIEAADEPAKTQAGFQRTGSGETVKDATQAAKQSFDASLENVHKSADLLVKKLRSLSDPPDEMEVVFSLKASGELGNIVIGKAGAEANYTVTLKWKRNEEEKKEAPKEAPPTANP